MAEKRISKNVNKRELDLKLDLLERRIDEARILYEQYFVDVIPHPPEKQAKTIRNQIRVLIKAPFKTSQHKFRLRALVTRFQTYATYWERVMKQREEGTYIKDIFRAEMREKMLEEAKREMTALGAAEKGMKQLYSSYEKALKKTGASTTNLEFASFKKKMLAQAKALKAKHGAKKLNYKIVVKNGKAVIKASAKK